MFSGSLEAEVADRIDELNARLNACMQELSIAKDTNEDLRRRNDDFKEYNNELVDKLSDVELDRESILEEREGLIAINTVERDRLGKMTEVMETQQREIEELKKEAGARSNSQAEEDKYRMFSRLMDGFERERGEWQRRNAHLQQLLKHATTDLLFLTRMNDSVTEALSQATHWEETIQPSMYRFGKNGTITPNVPNGTASQLNRNG